MNNLGFYGYHGVLKEEATLGQKFFIDMELYLDTRGAGQTDDMNKSVSCRCLWISKRNSRK